MAEFETITKPCPIFPSESILLPDGGILFVSEGSPMVGVVYRPDATGDYLNGSWSTPVSLAYRQNSSGMSIGQNGRVYKFGGHAGETGSEKVIEYNPVTHSLRDTGIVSHTHESLGVFEHNDGRLGRVAAATWVYIDTSTGEPVAGSQACSGAGGNEWGFTKLPDGSFVGFINPVSDAPFTGVKLINAGITAASDPAGFNAPTTYAATRWRYPYGATTSGGNGALRFHHGSEISTAIWMPKIQRAVMQGSYGAEIFSFDPATNAMTVPAHAIRPSNYTSILSTNFTCTPGITLTAGASVGSIDVVATFANYAFNGALGFSGARFFTTADGEFAFVTFTSATTVGGGALPGGSGSGGSAGDTIRLNGCVVVLGGGTAVGKVDNINLNVALGARESWSGITPQGDFIAQRLHGGYLTRWDGSSSSAPDPWLAAGIVAHYDITNGVGVQTWTPTGQMLKFNTTGNGHLWTPQGTPDSTQKPVITGFPGSARPGDTVTLSGNQLWGRHVGLNHNDDYSMRCNMPVVSLHAPDGRVYFCPSKNWSTRSISPNVASTCAVTIPVAVPAGTYQMRVASAGNVSEEREVKVGQSLGGGISINQYGGF